MLEEARISRQERKEKYLPDACITKIIRFLNTLGLTPVLLAKYGRITLKADDTLCYACFAFIRTHTGGIVSTVVRCNKGSIHLDNNVRYLQYFHNVYLDKAKDNITSNRPVVYPALCTKPKQKIRPHD